jgi:hypothetical protein
MGPNRRGIPRFARNDTILEGLFPQRLKPLLFCIPYGTAEAVPCKDFLGAMLAPRPASFQPGEIAVDRESWKIYPCGCTFVVPRGQ